MIRLIYSKTHLSLNRQMHGCFLRLGMVLPEQRCPGRALNHNLSRWIISPPIRSYFTDKVAGLSFGKTTLI